MIGLWLVAARFAFKAIRPLKSEPRRRSRYRPLTAPPPRPDPRDYPRSVTADLQTLYDRAGGTPFFEALVGRFYAGVADDPLLRADLPGSRPRRRPSAG